MIGGDRGNEKVGETEALSRGPCKLSQSSMRVHGCSVGKKTGSRFDAPARISTRTGAANDLVGIEQCGEINCCRALG